MPFVYGRSDPGSRPGIIIMFGQICKACGKPIWGNALIALNAAWHPEHFLCAACHQPIGGMVFHVHEGRPYHPACLTQYVLPRCVFCGKPLIGEFLVDQWGNQYCKEHQGQYPPCAYCGRLVPPEMQEEYGQHDAVRCPLCRKSAIETVKDAQPVFSQLKQWVSGQGLRYNNLPIALELCGRTTLASYLRDQHDHHTLGATLSTTYTADGRIVQNRVDKIAVLRGLPSFLFEGIVIHELGHAWLIVHGIQNLPQWAEEGFCELLAYRYYGEQGTEMARYRRESMLRNPDPIYGEGFRRMRTLAQHVGFEQLLEHLRITKRLPTLH